MTIRLDSYKTSMGSIYNTKPVITEIQQAIIRDGIDQTRLSVEPYNGINPVFVTGFFDSESRIPLFAHPISIFNFQGKDWICSDLRMFVKKGTMPSPSEILSGVRNLTEFDFAKSRTVLNMVWAGGGVSRIRTELVFAEGVYARWMAQAISRSFALDFKDQTVLSILASIFYQNQFVEMDKVWSEDERQLAAAHTMRVLQAPSDLVFSVIDRVEPMSDIHDFAATAGRLMENVRMKDFNAAQLLNILSSGWYGVNSKEILAVGLEHPPTFCAMVFTALKERTYRNSAIFQTADKLGKRGGSETFLRAYSLLVKDHLVLESAAITMESLEAFKDLLEASN